MGPRGSRRQRRADLHAGRASDISADGRLGVVFVLVGRPVLGREESQSPVTGADARPKSNQTRFVPGKTEPYSRPDWRDCLATAGSSFRLAHGLRLEP